MRVNVRQTILTLAIMAIALILIHSITQFWGEQPGVKRSLHMAFNLDMEGNVPTVFSVLLLFFIGVFSFFANRIELKKGDKDRFWILLTFIFIFLAFDEGGQLHEKLINPFQRVLGGDEEKHGILHYAWVIPYGVVSIVMGTVLLKYLIKIPSRTRNFFLIGGAVYFSGAIGMELVGGKTVEDLGQASTIYAWVATTEESLELTGLLLMLYTVLDHLRSEKAVELKFY